MQKRHSPWVDWWFDISTMLLRCVVLKITCLQTGIYIYRDGGYMACIYIHFLGWIYDLDIYPKIWKLIISYPYPKIPLISLSGDGMFLVFITLISEVCALRAQTRLIMEKNDMNENIALLILQWWENNLRDWYSWNHLYINSTRCENKIYLANGALIDFLLED